MQNLGCYTNKILYNSRTFQHPISPSFFENQLLECVFQVVLVDATIHFSQIEFIGAKAPTFVIALLDNVEAFKSYCICL
jgi:hypothetical protein